MLDMFGDCALHGAAQLDKAAQVCLGLLRAAAKLTGLAVGVRGWCSWAGAGTLGLWGGISAGLHSARWERAPELLRPPRCPPPCFCLQTGEPVEMENFFSRFGLDIIGKVGRPLACAQ